MLRILAASCVFVFVSSAPAQIIYEPVQYQYGGQNTYYYGGSDPAVGHLAQQPVDGGGAFGRVNGYAFVSSNLMSFREVSDEPMRAYADSMPRINAAIHGYNANDARREAYNNVPRYFRMRDLLAYATPDETGALHVPAQTPNSPAGTISIKPYVRPEPTTSPKPILIIPKNLLEPRPNNTVPTQVAAGQ